MLSVSETAHACRRAPGAGPATRLPGVSPAALRRGERDEACRPWLLRLASREAHALAHARAASEETARRVDPSQLPWVQQPAEERARLAQLVEDLRELPELQRSALLMRELTGLSHDEIATSLGTTRLGA